MVKGFKERFLVCVLVFAMTLANVLPTGSRVLATDADDLLTNEQSNGIERVVTTVVRLGALATYTLVAWVGGLDDTGKTLTMESLFFNRYNKTSLRIFDNMPTFYGGSNIKNQYVEQTLERPINDMFSFFTKLAMIAYIMMLVYVGIRVLIYAGTKNNAKYKEFVLYWVQGIILLFFFPYVMKYAIVINDTFVEFIYVNKANILNVGDGFNQAGMNAVSMNNGFSGLSEAMSSMMSFLNDDSSVDYMSVMYRNAEEKGWLVYGIAFAVMVKQLVTLLVIYFKRVIMTIFLIVIFPLVMISYAIDKLADGKSQAFGNWCKEFVLNVFLQSFHAIAYVICMALLVNLGTATGTTPADNWLLIIIVIAFISKADDMLRGIFGIKGGGGETVASFAATAAKTHLAVKTAQSAAKTAGKLVGGDSHLANVGRGIGNMSLLAMDLASDKMEAGRIRSEQSDDDVADSGIMAVSQTVDLDDNRSLSEYANRALEKDISEDERNAALDRILAVQNMEDGVEKEDKLNELAKAFEGREAELQELEAMLEVRAIQNAIMVGGLRDVELNEKIEILLERMKGKGLAALMASSVLGNRRNLKKIQMVNSLNLKRPSSKQSVLKGLKGKEAIKRAGTVGTRIPGDKYSGTFRTPEAMARRQARASERNRRYKLKAGGASVAGASSGVGAGGASGAARKSRLAMLSEMRNNHRNKRAARSELRSLENDAMRDVREINKLHREYNRLDLSSPKDKKRAETILKSIESLSGKSSNVYKLRRRRAELAKKGVHFKGVGKTQRTINRMAYVDGTKEKVGRFFRSKVGGADVTGVSSGVTGATSGGTAKSGVATMEYSNETKKFKESSEAKKSAKQARVMREKSYASAGVERKVRKPGEGPSGRASVSSRMFNRTEGKKVRMTTSDRAGDSSVGMSSNRSYKGSKSAFVAAREASSKNREASLARANGDRTLMEKYTKEAKQLEQKVSTTRKSTYRGYDLSGVKRATIPQKVERKASPKYTVKKLNALRKKSPEKLSEQERTMLENSTRNRRVIRDSGVVIRRPRREGGTDKPRVIRAPKAFNKVEPVIDRHDSSVNSVRKVAERTNGLRAVRKAQERPSKLKERLTEINESSSVFVSDRVSVGDGFDGNKSKLRLSDDVKKLARNKALDEPKTKISGRHVPPKDKEDSFNLVNLDAGFSKSEHATLVVKEAPIGSKHGSALGVRKSIVLNTESEVRDAEKIVEKIEMADKKISKDGEERIRNLSYSVVAINRSDYGDYTASEVIDHIDNIRDLLSAAPKGTDEHDVMQQVVRRLKYNLDDYDANVRIQVLNDDSLIADDDPRKGKIMEDSKKIVKKLPSDEILLSLLRNEAIDLNDGYTHSVRSIGEIASGLAISSGERDSLQSTLELALLEQQKDDRRREREYKLSKYQASIDADSKAIRKEAGSLAKNVAGTVFDATIRAPLDIGGGMLSAGISESSSGDLLVTAAKNGMTGFAVADSMYTGAVSLAGKGVKLVGSASNSIRDVVGAELKKKDYIGKDSKSSASGSGINSGVGAKVESYRRPTTMSEVVDIRKAEVRNMTSTPKAGSGETISERLRAMNTKSNNGNGNS